MGLIDEKKAAEGMPYEREAALLYAYAKLVRGEYRIDGASYDIRDVFINQRFGSYKYGGAACPLVIGRTFSQFWCAVVAGDAVCFPVLVGDTPGPDKERKQNQDKLSRYHYDGNSPFDFHVFNNQAQGSPDGICTVAWTRILKEATEHGEPKNVIGHLKSLADTGSQGIPLEIGTVTPDAMFLRVLRANAFARWPYGWKHVLIYTIPLRIWDMKYASRLALPCKKNRTVSP